MPLQQTSGNSTTDAYGGGVAVKAKYIEDFFVTWLRTGTGASATVTTGLNASANKALVWTKSRSAATDHKLTDTVRGATKALISDTTGAQTTDSTGLTAFSSTGYTVGADINYNNSGATYVDWEFVATPKFFDIVTYTGDGNGAVRKISHNLQGAVGAVFIKATSTTSDWFSAVGPVGGIYLNTTAAAAGLYSGTGPTNATGAFTSTTIDVTYVGDATTSPNVNGVTYVMYVFAHNAGGFGLTGTDNVISCGSFTATGNDNITLGYEPQWVVAKRTDGVGNWVMFDTMRGMPVSANSYYLYANTSDAEVNTAAQGITPTATGFNNQWFGAGSYIYIAIRRGPMKVPTDATKVFAPIASSATTGTALTTNFPVDMQLGAYRAGNTYNTTMVDRLRGAPQTSAATTDGPFLTTTSTIAERTSSGIPLAGTFSYNWWNTTFLMGGYYGGTSDIFWNFRRAPGFFDVVCWTATGAVQTVAHNLTVAPELIIAADRTLGQVKPVGGTVIPNTSYLILSTTAGTSSANNVWNNTSPTATNFTVNNAVSWINNAGDSNVAYLFATCPGVSKVGTYTGNGTTQTINCGFAGGARFVLIKRTDSTSSWYVYDTARGMTTGADPYLLLNLTSSESATLGSVTTVTTGFAVNASILAAINTNAATYIFLAIA